MTKDAPNSRSLAALLDEMTTGPRGDTTCHQFWLSSAEKRMVAASAAIRKQPNWENSLSDTESINRWSDESKSIFGLTDAEVEFVFDELEYYRKVNAASSASRLLLSTVDMLWQTTIPDDDPLAESIKTDVASDIEGIPEKFKDWAGGSCTSAHNGAANTSSDVLNLIDPSLYPLIYDRTPILSHPSQSPVDFIKHPCQGSIPGSGSAWKQHVLAMNRRHGGLESDKFIPICEQGLLADAHIGYSWLPTDIYVCGDGSVEIKSYINNLHPLRHATAYTVIASAISRCIPLLERTLTDLVHRRALRVPVNLDECLRETVPIPAYDYDKLSKIYGDSWQDMVHAWKKGLVYNDPVPGKFAEPDIPSPGHYTLNGEHMQVFVKMANVYLTPDKPEYTPDQSAFVPGTNSERIVATAMYLYDADNIEDIEVRFSESVDKHYYKSDIHNYIDHLVYGVSYPGVISDYSNDCGVIEINRGSLFCYPNTYERRIGTCRLDDKLRKGHFKMMILYFVNPAQRIISTSIVPPQQPRWSLSRLVVASSPLSRLPEDIQIMITEQLDRSTTYEEADRIRNRLTLKYHEYNKEYSSWRPGYSTSLNAYSRTFKPCL